MKVINIICDMQDSGLSGRAIERLIRDGLKIDLEQYVTSQIDGS